MRNLKFTLEKIEYEVQSYIKGDRAHIIPIVDGVKYSVIIDIAGKKIQGSYGMYSEKWHAITEAMDLNKIIPAIDEKMNELKAPIKDSKNPYLNDLIDSASLDEIKTAIETLR